MCKLIVGIPTKPNAEFSSLIQAQYKSLTTERQGIGAVVLTKDNKFHTFRSLNDYEKVMSQVDKLLPKAKLVGLHTRTSTGGTTDLSNVHFFQDGDWLFAHNGFVAKYHTAVGFEYHNSTVLRNQYDRTEVEEVSSVEDVPGHYTKKSEPCDSLQFLRTLPKTVTVESIDKHIDATNFTGMGFLINKKTRKSFVIVRKTVKILIGENFNAFFSYDPTKSIETVDFNFANGVEYIDHKEKKKITAPEKVAVFGTYELTY